MAVDDVGLGLTAAAHDMRDCQAVARAEVTAHRNAGDAERKVRPQGRQGCLGALAAGIAVCDQPNPMAARGLLAGKIENVAEQSADGRAKDMQDVQRRH